MPAVNFKAREFVERWKDKGSEDQDSHKFWFDFFENVLECSDPYESLDFERKVADGKIDIYVNHTAPIIKNGMNMVGVNVYWQKVVYGVIVLLAVAISIDRTSRNRIVK